MAINELEISFLQHLNSFLLTLAPNSRTDSIFPQPNAKVPWKLLFQPKVLFFKQIGNKVWTTEIPRMFSCQLPGCTFKRREQNLKTCY